MRQVRRLVCGGVLTLLAALATAGSAFAPPPACDLTQLQLRDSTVNQGLGSYDRLVRGKETLVRLYLSMPSCHDNNDQIQITAGSLDVTRGGDPLATGIAGTPSPVATYPVAATYATAPLNDAPADIKFVVPGANLAPGATTDSYTATFTARVTIQTKTSASGPLSAPVERTFTSFKTKTVERLTNALRILVVPFGNASNSYSTEFPAEAVSAVENGMQTLSRLFPVPDGVGTLGGGSGGIRYAIDSTLLDVTTPFCGTGANFDAIKAELAQFLTSWNTANPTAQADRVVGAVWSGNSQGSASGCAEGMASLISPEAWVRAFPDSVSSPSMTGALFAMEIGHTFGLTPAARSYSTFHSLNTAADGTSPNRGYNVATRSYLADDRTSMNFTGTWNNNTTLLEKADYAYLICVLGGQTNTECLTSNVAGTAGGVAALPHVFTVNGTTDNTPAGTEVEESFQAGNQSERGLDPDSDYRLVQRAPDNVVLQTDRVRVAFGESHHDDDTPENTSTKGTFAAVVPLQEAATKFQLWKGAVGTGTLLWSALKTDPPTITSFSGGGLSVTNFTNSPGIDDKQPSLTIDGQWVAWTSGDDVKIARTDGSSAPVSVPRPGAPVPQERIVFSSGRDGNYEIYSMDSGGGDVVNLTNNPADDRDPVISADGLTIVFIRDGDVWAMNSDGSNARAVTQTALTEADPTLSADGRIAFARNGAAPDSDQEIWVMDAEGTNEVQLTDNSVGDQHPTWSRDGLTVAFATLATPSGQWNIFSANADGSGTPAAVPGTIDGDVAPAYSPDGRRIALTRAWNDGTSVDVDIFVLDVATGERQQLFYTQNRNELQPSWSPDGTRMVFHSYDQFAPPSPPDPFGVIEYVDLAASDVLIPLTNNQADDMQPNWGMLAGPPPPVQEPAWNQQTAAAQLAFVSEGNIYTIDVDLAGPTPVLGTPTMVYDANQGGGPASHLSWNPTGTEIAFQRGTQIITLIVASGVAFPTVNDAHDPAWSRSQNRMAYVKDVAGVGSQIWSFVPGVEFSDVLHTTGTEPAWGPGADFTFTRANEIWVYDTGRGTEQRVVGNGGDSDLANLRAAFVRSFPVGIEDSQTDIMFVAGGGRLGRITVQISDDNPEENRLDILVDCGSLVYVAAVALAPDQADAGSASWQANFDPSLTCTNPEIKVAVSDGYNRVTTADGDEVESEQKPPTAAIYTPFAGSVFDQYDLIPARGSGWDAEDGTIPGTGLSWQLSGPGYSASGTGPIVDFSAPTGGFPLGAYELTLTVVDSAGNTDTESRSFTIVGDQDNDGLTDEEEGLACIASTFDPFYGSAALDPLTAYLDGDGDGIPNVDDPAVCTPADAYEALVDFDPEVSQGRSGGVATAYVRLRYRDVRAVDGSSVKISRINGIAANIPAIRWNIDRSGAGVAQFNRDPLLAFLREHDIDNEFALITVSGSAAGGAWSFSGSDMTFVR